MHLILHSSQSILEGSKEQLDIVHKHFSFTDKAAENQLSRWKKGLFWKEKGLLAQAGELPESYLAWKKSEEKKLKEAIKVYCCQPLAENAKDTLVVPTGLVLSLTEFCLNQNIKLTIDDQRNFDLDRKLLLGAKPNSLRKPQQESLDVITGTRPAIHRGTGLVRLATGVGKTALAQELIRFFGVKSIFLVPSLPILEQTITRFEMAFGKKNVRAYGGGKKNMGYVTVATYQSVYKADPDDFSEVDLVVADECHHVSADTFYDVMTLKLKNAVHRYGLTAFEERADNSTLLIESAVGPVIYQYDAPEAIADGFLAKPMFIFYDVFETRGTWIKYKIKDKVRTAVKDVSSINYEGSDDIEAYRHWILGNDILNEKISNLTNAFVADGQSVLILVDEKEHGDRLMKLIPDAGYAVGGGKDNVRLQREFNARKLKVLIGTSCLAEGADTIAVDVLINLQGGTSKSKVLQAYGRALRNDPDDNGIPRKPTSIIIDFNFPLNKLLARHSQSRLMIAKPMGVTHRSKLD